jgi:hypothetical protein
LYAGFVALDRSLCTWRTAGGVNEFLLDKCVRYGRSYTEPLASSAFVVKEDLHP